MKRIPYIDDFDQWIEEFEFYITVRVRFSETDMFGHVNNTVPFIYFEQARIEFFKAIGVMFDLKNHEQEYIPVVADLQCDFLEQMYFDDEIRVYVKVDRIGKSSLDIHYMAKRNNETICLAGRSALVKINRKTGKSAPWTEKERERLSRYGKRA